MTPPKTASQLPKLPPMTCEETPEPSYIYDLPKAGKVSDPGKSEKSMIGSLQRPKQVYVGEMLDGEIWSPKLMAPPQWPRTPFDPTRYGLPPDWKENRPFYPEGTSPFQLPENIKPSDLFIGSEAPQMGQSPWLKAVIDILNRVKSADLDVYNVPVNQGTNLRRFSEYAPKDKPLKPPNLDVWANTTAYVRGEVRPVQGQKDSLITRWVIRYTPAIRHESGLFIRGFSAADAPDIQYDPKFGQWQAVRKISGGDLDYENPQHTGAPMKTPFDSVAPPLPEGHRDWMIAFNPMINSMEDSLKAAVAFGRADWLHSIPFVSPFLQGPVDSGRGKLYLWAFVPTVGVAPSREYFKKFGIRYNTMPRRPGDLVDFYSPLFNKYRGGLLKHNAPYYNPNSEYWALYVEKGEKVKKLAKEKFGANYNDPPEKACQDLKGQWKQNQCKLPLPKRYWKILNINEERVKDCEKLKSQGKKRQCQLPIGRQQIPHSRAEVAKINAQRKLFGVPEIGARRGSIIDWIFSDIKNDPERLQSMAKKPWGKMHLQMKPGHLKLPLGNLQVSDNTDILLKYFIRPIEVPDLDNPGKKKLEAQIGIRLTLTPLKINKADLRMLGFHFQADRLKADKMVIEIPSIPGWDEAQAQTRPPIKATIQGVHAEGVHFRDDRGDVDISMKMAEFEEMRLHFKYPPRLFGSNLDKREERVQRIANCEKLIKSGDELLCNEPKALVYLKGIKGQQLEVGVPQIQGLTVADFKIPSLKVNHQFKTKAEETITDRIEVKIPLLQSKGSMDLNFEEREKTREAKNGDGTSVHLEGGSTLEDIHLTSQFKGDHSLLQGQFKLRGTIDRATVTKKGMGEVSFTTKTNGHKLKPVSGNVSLEVINPAKKPYQTNRPKGPPPQFDLDLDLPYVGFAAKGDFTIPPGSSTLRDGKFSIKADPIPSGILKGELQLNDASYLYKKKKPLEWGRLDFYPFLTGINSSGKFKIEILPDGFRLANLGDPKTNPLNLSFFLNGTQVHHCPDLSKKHYRNRPEASVIQTDAKLDQIKIDIKDFRSGEIRNLTVDGETQPRITHLHSGPILGHQIEGTSSIWVDLWIWDFVRGLFPKMGGPPSKKNPRLPDSRALTSHLPPEEKKELRALIGESDYIYVGEVRFDRKEKDWIAYTKDLIFNLHEEGGRRQFAMVRFPAARFGMKGENLILDPGPGNFLLNINLKDPDYRGFFKFDTPYRWRKALKKE